jgi:hypothetical protein
MQSETLLILLKKLYRSEGEKVVSNGGVLFLERKGGFGLFFCHILLSW